jgi:hypothetical protein
MNKRKICTIVGILLVLLLLTVLPTSANPNWISVEAIEIFCSYEIGEFWVDGDMYYERGSIQTGFKIPLTEGDPFPLGEYVSEVNLDLNFATGEGKGYGATYFDAEGDGGYFVGWWHGTLIEYAPGIWISPKALAVTKGIDDIAGWRTKSKAYAIDPAPYAGMCGGADPVGVMYLELDYKQPK